MMSNQVLKLLMVFILLPALCWGQSQTGLSRIRTGSGDLDVGSFSFTTDFNTVGTWYLSHVVVNFDGPPEAVETVNIFLSSSRFTEEFNAELISLQTEAELTSRIFFLFNRGIPVTNGDQITITVSNASQSENEPNDDPSVNVLVALGFTPGLMTSLVVYRDGNQVELMRGPIPGGGRGR